MKYCTVIFTLCFFAHCSFEQDYYQNLGSDYYYFSEGKEYTSIVRKQNNISSSDVICPSILKYKKNDRYIIVCQKNTRYSIECTINFSFEEDVVFWIIDKNIGETHGPLSLLNYLELKDSLDINLVLGL